MKPFKLFILLLFTQVIFLACDSDDEKSNDRTKMLTSKSWKTTAATISPAFSYQGRQITDLYNDFYDDCVNDNIITFNSNGVIVNDEAATKCEASDPQSNSGTWSFNTDKTILTITIGSSTTNYSIVDFNKNTLKVSFTEVVNNTTYTINETYTAQ